MTMFVGLSKISLSPLSQHSGRCPGARLTNRIERIRNDQPEQQVKRSTSSSRRRSGPGNAIHSMQEGLIRLEKAVKQGFTVPFPVSKTDPLDVYLAYIRIISIISDKMHDDKNHGINCLCFAEVLLTATDHYKTIHISCSRLDVRNWWRLAKMQ